MKTHHLRKIYLLIMLIFGVLAVVAVAAWRSIQSAQHGSDWLNQTYATVHELDLTLSFLRTGDAAVRTYLLSGEARDMADARAAFGEMSDHWQTVKAMLRHDESVTADLAELENLMNRRETWARTVWTEHQAGRADEVASLLTADAGSAEMAEISRGFARLRSAQLDLIGARDAESYRRMQTTRWILGLGVAVNLVLFGAVIWLIRDDLAAHEQVQRTLQTANAQLEERVQERTAELTAANDQLTQENLERRWSNQALEHQLRYNQQIVSAVTDLVIVTTKALNLTRINPAVTHCTGFDEKELLGQHLRKVVDFGDGEAAASGWEAVTRALREGRDWSNRSIRVETKSGVKVASMLNLFPLRDGNKVVGSVFILRIPSSDNLSHS